MSTAEELKALGNKAFAEKDFETAIKHYTEAIEKDPSNHVLFSNRSACYASLDKFSDALADAEKTISLKSDWPKGYSRKAAAQYGMKDYMSAKITYEEALQQFPDNQQLKEGLEQADALLAEQMNQRSNQANQMGQIFTKPNALEKLMANPQTSKFFADPHFAANFKKVQEDPSYVQNVFDERMLQCMIALLQDDVPADMKGVFEEVSKQAPKPKEGDAASATSSAAESTASSSATGAESFEKKPEDKKPAEQTPMDTKEDDEASDIDPETLEKQKKAESEKALGTAAYKKKDFETALKHYNAAAELDPTNMVYNLNIAAVYLEQKEYQKCVDECMKAVEIGMDQRADYKLLAKAYMRAAKADQKAGNLKDAIKWCDKAMANHRTPDNLAFKKKVEKELKEAEAKAYIDPEKSLEAKNRGNELFKNGKYPEAIKEYNDAIKRNPDDGKLYSNRAACYTKLAELGLALKDCDECIKRAPDFVKGYLRKGNVLLAMKKYKDAVEAFEGALKVEPNHPEAQDGIARARQGQYGFSGESREERAANAMKDPEIQSIMGDPVMQTILQQMQQDPSAVQEHMKNPAIAEKIMKLADAGILSFGR